MKEISINSNYFDTLQFQEYTLFNIQKPSRRKKTFISENVYVSNLNPAVMTLPFGGTRCGTRMSPIGQSQHQHLRLIGTALGTGSMLVDMLSVQQRACCLRQMLSSYQSEVLVMRPTDLRRPYSASCIPER